MVQSIFSFMKKNWWKIVTVVLLVYTFIAGFLKPVPYLSNLGESIRNLYFHVPMWFGMMVLYAVSLVNAIRYLSKKNLRYDIYSEAYARSGIVFGVLGITTGMIWANYTWGEPWSNDPKQNGAAIGLLIYFAYMVLRNSITDLDKRARISAVYNIFAFFILIPAIWIMPRLEESLHPGGQGVEGNPGINGSDLDPSMRIIFWPAVIGWSLLGVWITTLYIRLKNLKDKHLMHA